MYYAFTPDSVFKSVPPNGSEPTWQTSMLYSDIVLLICVAEIICMVICPPISSMAPDDLSGAKIIPKYILWMGGPGAILSFRTFLSFISRLLEKAMATHSSTLVWKIPWTEETDRLQSMGS